LNFEILLIFLNDYFLIDNLIITKENATSFLLNKREINSVKESSLSHIKNNYEILLEQIYIERSVSVISAHR
jgi:hypothetical protein